METLEQEQKEFKKLVNDYRQAVITMCRMILHDCVCQHDRDDEKNTKEQVIETYRKFSQNKKRDDLLFIAIRTMSNLARPMSCDHLMGEENARRLTNWLRDLGVELVDELGKIY